MAKVRYTIRLYRLHDLDLITFVLTHEFDILHAIYSSVTAFAKGEAFIIKIPPSVKSELPQLRRVYTKALVLDDEIDKATIEMIEKITPGKRNNFFKNLLRLYLMYPFSEEFFESKNDVVLFESKLKAFRTDQREVRAGKVKKTHTRENIQKELSSLKTEPVKNTEKIKVEAPEIVSNNIKANKQIDDTASLDLESSDEERNQILEIFGGLEMEG